MDRRIETARTMLRPPRSGKVRRLTQAEGAGMSESQSHSPIQFFTDNYLYAPDHPALRVIATESTMRFWRHMGRGPSYSKSEGTNGKIWYSGHDLNDYLMRQRIEVAA